MSEKNIDIDSEDVNKTPDEKLEKYINADKKIVSKHSWLLDQISKQFEKNSGSGEDVGYKKYICKTKEYDGLNIYIDKEEKLWAGDDEWVVPIILNLM